MKYVLAMCHFSICQSFCGHRSCVWTCRIPVSVIILQNLIVWDLASINLGRVTGQNKKKRGINNVMLYQ